MKKIGLLMVTAFSLFLLAACEESPREEALEKQKQALEAEKQAIEERIDVVEEQKEIAEEQWEALKRAKGNI
jgi:hypothetical protein